MGLNIVQSTFLLLYFVKTVIAKECRYIFENGDIKFFHCSLYEYCCGTMCCRSPAMTFYQMWYFWLMVFLTVLFCSGGGWWYKIRNPDGTISSGAPRVMPTQLVSYYDNSHNPRPLYPQNAYFQPIPYPAQTVQLPVQQQHQYPPPPPYFGPPPSYDTVVNQQPPTQQPVTRQN